MPAWLVELTRDTPRMISERAVAAIRRTEYVGLPGTYGAAAIEAEIEALTNTAPGGRNQALNKAAFNLFQLVAGGELAAGEVERRLIGACEANGLVSDDGLRSVEATIASGRNAGLQSPRSRKGAA